MNNLIIGIIVGVIIGVGSSYGLSLIGDNDDFDNSLKLSDEEKKEIKIAISNYCNKINAVDWDFECTNDVYSSFFMKKQLGL